MTAVADHYAELAERATAIHAQERVKTDARFRTADLLECIATSGLSPNQRTLWLRLALPHIDDQTAAMHADTLDHWGEAVRLAWTNEDYDGLVYAVDAALTAEHTAIAAAHTDSQDRPERWEGRGGPGTPEKAAS